MADTKAAGTNGSAAPMVLRAGMKRLGSVANAPWWNIEKGAKLFGTLEGMFQRPDERAKGGKSKFFQITALEDTKARFGRGKEAKVQSVKAGTVVNVNYGPKTRDLEPLIDHLLRGARFNVEIICKDDKMDIGKGQTMWPLEVGSVMTQAPQLADEPDFDGSEGDDDDAPAAGAATA